MTLRHDWSLKEIVVSIAEVSAKKRVFITHFSTESLWFWENAVAQDPVLVKYKVIYVYTNHKYIHTHVDVV